MSTYEQGQRVPLSLDTHVCEDTRVCEQPPLPLPNEDEVAHRWWSLAPGTHLSLAHGNMCRVHFVGIPGGGAGPDVRDAVLFFKQGRIYKKHVGDVEFHVRASDWTAHQHHTDPRYNDVMLHVVLVCDDLHPTRVQSGRPVPVCPLNDVPRPPLLSEPHNDTPWPCHSVMRQLGDEEREMLFKRAGLLRFEQKAHAFVEQLHAMPEPLAHYDLCLIPALAEGLAYGRDRAFFRAVGLRLFDRAQPLPEPLGRTEWPAPLDEHRLSVLYALVEQCVWLTLREMLVSTQAMETKLHTLRSFFLELGLSLARTDILLCNVVLPFAAAVALVEHNIQLGNYAQDLYEVHPGLPSNRITRMMSRQLLLPREPRGGCQQQGLHYLYQQTCQEKQCGVCIAGRSRL